MVKSVLYNEFWQEFIVSCYLICFKAKNNLFHLADIDHIPIHITIKFLIDEDIYLPNK